MKRTINKVYPFVERVSNLGPRHPITTNFLTKRYWNINRELTYPETPDPSTWNIWRKKLRFSLRKHLCLDAWGVAPTPPVEVLEKIDCDGYVRQKIAYQSLADNWIVAYLLIPKRPKESIPAILCPHGHVETAKLSVVDPKFAFGRGVAYGHEFAKRGCAVLAPDNAGMGERDASVSNEIGRPKVRGCQLLYNRLTHMGLDVTGLRIFELMVGLNILANMKEVDASKIGCAGLSGGCWLAQVLTALDERIKTVILSGFFTTFVQTIWNGHCVCHLTYGLGKVCDIPDISALVAPRPQFIESGKQDYPYPLEPAYSLVRKAYTLLGVEENLGIDIYEGGHMFHGKYSIPWMMKQLNR